MKNDRMIELRGGRSQREVAGLLKIPLSTYAMIECGHRFPRKALAIKIAEFYKVTVGYLFFGQDDHETRPNKESA